MLVFERPSEITISTTVGELQAAYGDRHVYAAISRFLPESLHDRFVHLTPGRETAGACAARVEVGMQAPIDIGARVRSAWG